jgi:hypothetical protein
MIEAARRPEPLSFFDARAWSLFSVGHKSGVERRQSKSLRLDCSIDFLSFHDTSAAAHTAYLCTADILDSLFTQVVYTHTAFQVTSQTSKVRNLSQQHGDKWFYLNKICGG